jgi:Homeodomain-like domain
MLRLDVTTVRASSRSATGDYPARSVAVACDRLSLPAMPAGDRVRERRRAAALARHYRDEEGLPIAEIARRLGRVEATVRRTCTTHPRLTKDLL